MKNLHIILIIIIIFSLVFNYLSFNSKKTALQLVNDMGIGYNLGNTFNCCNIIIEKYSENEEIKLLGTTLPSKNILKEVKKYGFKTIRFQILYNNYTYNNGKINSEVIYKIKKLINMIRQFNMYIILSIKHTRQFWDSEGKNSKDKYINFWMQLANELINYDDHLIFESMYEIGYLTYLDNMYDYYEDKDYLVSQDFINVIRDSGGLNIERLLIIPMISSDYEVSLIDYGYYEYKIPKDPYNKLAISIYYYFPCDLNNPLDLDSFKLYDKLGYFIETFPLMEWGSSQNYIDILSNFDNIKKYFIDKGFPVIIGEVGILNDYIKKNNSLEQFLYTILSLSNEYEGILPCLWDIPITSLSNSNFTNYYLNKNNNEWSNNKYGIIFRKINKGQFINSIDYYFHTNLETEVNANFGMINIYAYTKRIIKIIINVRFFIHIENDFVLTVYSSDIDYSFYSFELKEKDGKRQYDGTSIFTIDASELELCGYVQVYASFNDNYMIINNVTVLYEKEFSKFDYLSYKNDILNGISY